MWQERTGEWGTHWYWGHCEAGSGPPTESEGEGVRLVSKVTGPSTFSKFRASGLLEREAKDPFSTMVEPLGDMDGGTKALLPTFGWLNRYHVLLPGMSTHGRWEQILMLPSKSGAKFIGLWFLY